MCLPVLVLATALSAAAGDARKAAQLEAWGDLAEARAEVDAALARDGREPTALFVAACLDIEAGDLVAAERRAGELADAGVAQGRVLRALVERRRAAPEESLADAIAPAWKGAGRPDLEVSRLTGIDEQFWLGSLGEMDGDAGEKMTPSDRVVFGSWTASDRRAAAFAAAAHPGRNPLSVNHALLSAFHDGEKPPDGEARAAVSRIGEALAAADPDNGYWGFATWLASGSYSEPLTATDLDDLERHASRPRFELPRARLLGELRELAARFDPRHARCRAALAELGAGDSTVALQLRVKATRWDGHAGAVLEARTARVLMTIGGRLASSRTYLERIVGLSLVEMGARLSGDPKVIEAATRKAMQQRDRYHRAGEAARRAGTWPFSALCRDWTPDEITSFERYLD